MNVPEPLLGLTAFEGLGVKIDPCTGKLEYSTPYGLAILPALGNSILRL